MSTHSLQGRLVLRHEALGLPVSSHGAYQGRASPKRMTDSKEEGSSEAPSNAYCLAKNATCQKRMSGTGKENVRASTMVFIGKHTSLKGGVVCSPGSNISDTPGLPFVWDHVPRTPTPILLGQGPFSTAEPSARPGTHHGVVKGPTSRPSLPRSKSGVKKGLDMKEVFRTQGMLEQQDPVTSESEILSCRK